MQACHQGRVPHCASFPIWHVGSEYLSEALPHDVHLSLVLIIEHSPRFKSQSVEDPGAFALCDKQGAKLFVLPTSKLFCVQAFILDGSCLL